MDPQEVQRELQQRDYTIQQLTDQITVHQTDRDNLVRQHEATVVALKQQIERGGGDKGKEY